MAHTANSPSQLNIRLATPDDIPAMVPMVNAAFAIESFLEGTRTDEERMKALMHDGEFLVAEDEGDRILASVYVEKLGDDRAYLGMLAVDPSRQGSGLGRMLTEAAEEHCRRLGYKCLDIVVLSLRSELLPLYRKLGFVETGTQEFRPSRPLKAGVECHGITMTKEL
ncbi:MAG: GNAT family N-acetyltransferase [Terriglobales bacterium]